MLQRNEVPRLTVLLVCAVSFSHPGALLAFDVDAAKVFHQRIASQQDDVQCLQQSQLEACVRLWKEPGSHFDRTYEKLVQIVRDRPSIADLELIVEKRVFASSYKDRIYVQNALQGLYRAEGKARKQSAYFFKSYKLDNNTADFKEIITYANIDEFLKYHERDFTNKPEFKQEALAKLRAGSDSKSALNAYLISNEQSDLKRALAGAKNVEKDTANRIFTELFKVSVSSVAQLPAFFSSLANCSQCDSRHFYSMSKSLADFGKNLNLDSFIDSIEYRNVLRHEPITVGYSQDGSSFVVKISYAGGEHRKSYSANCQTRGSESRTESVGFFEGMFAPSTTKTVAYESSECRPRPDDIRHLANLERTLTGSSKSSTAFESQGPWARRVAVSSSYDRSSSSGSGGGAVNVMNVNVSCIAVICTPEAFQLRGGSGQQVNMGYNSATVVAAGSPLAGTYHFSVKLTPSNRHCSGSFSINGRNQWVKLGVFESCKFEVNEF